MFNKPKQLQVVPPVQEPGQSCSLICKSSVFKGEIRSKTDVRIEGMFEGNIDIQGTLYVASGGRVSAESVVCCKADISGSISGTLTAREILYIRPGGTVTGDISVADMVIEQGGFFDGRSRKIGPAEKQLPGAAKQVPATGMSQQGTPKVEPH